MPGGKQAARALSTPDVNPYRAREFLTLAIRSPEDMRVEYVLSREPVPEGVCGFAWMRAAYANAARGSAGVQNACEVRAVLQTESAPRYFAMGWVEPQDVEVAPPQPKTGFEGGRRRIDVREPAR